MLQEDFKSKGSWVDSGIKNYKHFYHSAGIDYQDKFNRGLYAKDFGDHAISKALALPRGKFAIRFDSK
jgi:hypothetical protein